MISNFFIDRPLFAMVVSAFIVIAGLAAFQCAAGLDVSGIAPPTVAVTDGVSGRERGRHRGDGRRRRSSRR